MKKSFTLLEMLIVLGIIATILSVLAVSFTTTQKKSRDAKRRGDIKALQNGLEQYYSVCHYVYPTSTSEESLDDSITCEAEDAVIIPVVPKDPKTGESYTYSSDDGATFSLCTDSIESDAVTRFCVQNQQ